MDQQELNEQAEQARLDYEESQKIKSNEELAQFIAKDLWKRCLLHANTKEAAAHRILYYLNGYAPASNYLS